MTSGVELRTELFPLVITTLRGRPTDAQMETYFVAFERIVARKRPFASLVDTTALEMVPTAAQRKRIADVQAEWVAKHGTEMGLGVAMVVQNTLIRGAITALHWLMPPPVPTQAFGDSASALQFLVDNMAKRGVPASEEIRSMLARLRLAS